MPFTSGEFGSESHMHLVVTSLPCPSVWNSSSVSHDFDTFENYKPVILYIVPQLELVFSWLDLDCACLTGISQKWSCVLFIISGHRVFICPITNNDHFTQYSGCLQGSSLYSFSFHLCNNILRRSILKLCKFSICYWTLNLSTTY